MEIRLLVLECGCARMVPLHFIDMTELTIDILCLTHAMLPTVVQHRLRLDGLCVCLSLSLQGPSSSYGYYISKTSTDASHLNQVDILYLFSPLCCLVGLPIILFPAVFPAKVLYAYLVSSVSAIRSTTYSLIFCVRS